MQDLIADLFNFLALLSNCYFRKEDWALDYLCTQFHNFTKISTLGLLATREVTRTLSLQW